MKTKGTLVIYNGVLTYQYILNGEREYSLDPLIEKLAIEAGYKVERQGNGLRNYGDKEDIVVTFQINDKTGEINWK